MMQIRPNMCLSGVSMTKNIVQGIKTPKTPQKWAWFGNFKPKVRKVEIAMSSTVSQINTIFEGTP